jgi:hypothetical protein
MSFGGDVPDESLKQKHGLGATRRWPHGRLGPDDQGEIKVAIAADLDNGRVQIEFGKPVAWLSLTPADALALAGKLVEKAQVCRRHRG